jgi:hypothetical protein
MGFHTVFVQIVNAGHPVGHDVPQARILRAVTSESKVALCRTLVHKAFPESTVIEARPDELIPITHGPEPKAYMEAKAKKLHKQDLDAEKAELQDFKNVGYMRSKGNESGAFKSIEAFTQEWNNRPWVQLMKRKAGLKDDFMMYPSSGAWHRSDDASDDDLGKTPHLEISKPVPETVRSTKQAFAVISIVEDRYDVKVEPGIRVHGLYGDLQSAEVASESWEIRKAANPAPTLVIDTGGWIPLLDPLWDDTVFDNISYGNKELEKFQRSRREHIADYYSAKAEASEYRAQNTSRMHDVAEQLGMRFDEVETISKTDAGVEQLQDCMMIESHACREDAVDALRVTYLGADPDTV